MEVYNRSMAWEKINERLKKVFNVEVSFPGGTVWLPDRHLTIDQWLVSLAETDEELKELNIRRIEFLRNRWRFEELLELKWDKPADRRTVWAMYAGSHAYILFCDGVKYHLIAAITPRDRSTLYRAVIGKLLQNPNFVPPHPRTLKKFRPDLVPETDDVWSAEAAPAAVPAKSGFGGFLSELLVGWIGKWIDLPELGFWHEDVPDSISTPEKGKYVMRYKETYGDKQREAQRQKKSEEARSRTTEEQEEAPKAPEKSTPSANPTKRPDTHVA